MKHYRVSAFCDCCLKIVCRTRSFYLRKLHCCQGFDLLSKMLPSLHKIVYCACSRTPGSTAQLYFYFPSNVSQEKFREQVCDERKASNSILCLGDRCSLLIQQIHGVNSEYVLQNLTYIAFGSGLMDRAFQRLRVILISRIILY